MRSFVVFVFALAIVCVNMAWAADCGKCKIDPCTCKCECEKAPDCGPCCEGGMDAIMKGFTLIPFSESVFTMLDPACCTGDDFKLLTKDCWCTEYSFCCQRQGFDLLCKPKCKPKCCGCQPCKPKCKQDICTPKPGKCCP